MLCYYTKSPIFALGTEKETIILSTINVQGKKLQTMKTFNRLVAWANRAWRHWCHKHNVVSQSIFRYWKEYYIMIKIETFVKNNKSSFKRPWGFLKIDEKEYIINPNPLQNKHFWFDELLDNQNRRKAAKLHWATANTGYSATGTSFICQTSLSLQTVGLGVWAYDR